MRSAVRRAEPWLPVAAVLASVGLLRLALIGWGTATGARTTSTTAGQVALAVDTVMAAQLFVAALPAVWPQARRLWLACVVGAVATLTAVVGTGVWIALGSSSAHGDPSAWSVQIGRIVWAVAVGLAMAVLCGWQPWRRISDTAPNGDRAVSPGP